MLSLKATTVKEKITQYSGSNAWNVNMETGNSNANNRYNSNYVRGVSAFQINNNRYDVPLEDILEAYFVCRKNKRSTINALIFEMDYRHKCIELTREINERTYEIGSSICFFVYKPQKREIFAADFRDRIIHHFIALRLEPLFEKHLQSYIFASRRGKGTLQAIQSVQELVKNADSNQWIYKADHQGFFYSIDKRILWNRLERFIQERYHEEDKDTLLWLTKKVIFHQPQKNCILRSPESEWENFPKCKSLRFSDEYHGLPIGDLSSQMFANFLLADVFSFLESQGVKNIVDYVDDFVCVGDKERLLSVIPLLREYEKRELNFTLHPRKSYFQQVNKGVKFLGAKMNKYRAYISYGTLSRCYNKIHYFTKRKVPLRYLQSVVNSYFGLLSKYSTYKHRKKLADKILQSYKGIYFNNDIKKLKVCKSYGKQR